MNTNEKETKELELLVKQLFKQSHTKAEVSSKARLKTIISRGLHELALRDILILVGNMILVMATLSSSFIKLILKNNHYK